MNPSAHRFAKRYNTKPALFYKIQQWREFGLKTRDIQRLLKVEGVEIKYSTLRYWVRIVEEDKL